MTYFTIAGLQLNLKDRQNFDIFRDKVRSTMRRFPFVQMIVGSELSICGAGVGYAGPMIEEVEDSLCELAAEFNIWLIPSPGNELRILSKLYICSKTESMFFHTKYCVWKNV